MNIMKDVQIASSYIKLRVNCSFHKIYMSTHIVNIKKQLHHTSIDHLTEIYLEMKMLTN